MASTAPVPVSPTRDEDEGTVAQLFNFDACVWFLLGNSGTRRSARRARGELGDTYDLRQRPGHSSVTQTEAYVEFLPQGQRRVARHGKRAVS
jgi:hypothetical protein